MLPRLMFASERDTLSVVHNGTDHTVVAAGDIVVCFQWVALSVVPALGGGFISLATDLYNAGSPVSFPPSIGMRASYKVADGPISVAPEYLHRLIVLRPTKPVLVETVVSPIDLSVHGDPLGIIYWGMRAASGGGNTPTAGSLTPTVSPDVNYRVNQTSSNGNGTSHGSSVCTAFIGPEKTLDPISYTGNTGTNTDFRGWLKIYGQ